MNGLFERQVDWEALDLVAAPVHGEAQESPAGLRGPDVPAIEEFLHLVPPMLQARSVWAFISVLV